MTSPHTVKMITLGIITFFVVAGLPVQWKRNNDAGMNTANYSHLIYALFLSLCLGMAVSYRRKGDYDTENTFLWAGLIPTIIGFVLLILTIAFFVDHR
jgi:uncharacterized membrane protein